MQVWASLYLNFTILGIVSEIEASILGFSEFGSLSFKRETLRQPDQLLPMVYGRFKEVHKPY